MTPIPSFCVRRFARDAGAAFALFSGLFLLTASGPGHAADTFAPVAAGASGLLDYLVIAGLFSLITAFNLAFFRHIRQAYADPRKRRSTK